MSTPTPTPGHDPALAALERVLGAQYEIVRVLGRGGMGVVYLARERLLDRLVAIKVLSPEKVDDESRERFLREARTAARLTHPNIVPLYSFGQSDELVFYVMGYVDGESLESHLRRVARMAPAEASRILGELADALDYAHRSGVVHRDIKPDNVLLERGTGRAVLTDFGIAKLDRVSKLTETGVVVGTPHYMSPEQGAGDREIDGRSDLYSLGVMGYRMLTGRLPFEAKTFQELLAQHANRYPSPVTALAPDIDPVLSAAIARCLEKRPEDRWMSAAALAASLEARNSNPIPLPEGLEHLPSHGLTLFAAWWAWNLLMMGMWGGSGKSQWLILSVFSAVLAGIALGSSVFVAARMGIRPKRSLALMFAPPRWWPTVWINRLRRPGDVWLRLPKPIREYRTMFGIGVITSLVVLLPVYTKFWIAGLASPEPNPVGLRAFFDTLSWYFPAVLFGIPSGIRFSRWAKKLGLPQPIQRKLTTEPTWNSRFWSRPDVAPVLTPAVEVPFADAPLHTAPALVAAIEMALADLESIDADLARDVRKTARDTADVLGAFEQEIESIAAGLNRQEVEQMRARLPRFDEPALRPMRQIIDQQLELLAHLEKRQRELEERRDAGLARLHTLWLQLKALRAQRALESADAAEITGRIRALCADVGRLRSALDEVHDLARTPH